MLKNKLIHLPTSTLRSVSQIGYTVPTMQQLSVQTPIAYFCAEFGFDTAIPIYAGGLGILAGDTMKEAADQNIPFVGVGLLYRGYGTVQKVTPEGMQIEENNLFDPVVVGFEHVYVDDMPLFVKVELTQVDVWVRCWKKTFSDATTLYLLDTQTDQNLPSERDITSTLYSGTQDTLLKQQLILGIGGVRLLTALGIHPKIFHMNEGRPNFLHWQLLLDNMQNHGLDYSSAKAAAKQQTVYTNHTLVAAGNQSYSPEILKAYAGWYAEQMGVTTTELISDGVEAETGQFSITQAALNTSRKANGVSALHTKLSQEHWSEYDWTNITNGVHLPTWQSARIAQAQHSPTDLWAAHCAEKRELESFVKKTTGYGYNPEFFVIGWARRLAGYKQLDMIFQDIERLRAILKRVDRPIQLLVSGKAHQGDGKGKQLLQEVITYMKRELVGHALFIPNYNISIAQHLTRGVDLWLNTPEMGREACGTSGMKALSNGVLNLTVADGWAHEVSWDGVGFVLDHTNLPVDLYENLENNSTALFYNRSQAGIPEQWVAMMQRSIALSEQFSSKRMLQEYLEKLY